jgi:2-amino-4-hydroxy-6-hydroxymethyldihydropteridine diphosphokinase
MAAPISSSRIACVALGSNLGDRQGVLRDAFEALGQLPTTTLRAASRLHETDPIGPAGQGKYLNAAARLETRLEARALLEHLLEIERRFGRERREPWGPRTLDLDLILFGAERIEAPGLTVPHPRFRERAFVLQPLTEVAADLVDPVTGKTVRRLCEEVSAAGGPAVEPFRDGF